MAQGVPGWLRPQIFLTFQHYKGGRSSAKRTGRLYPRINSWYSLSEAESTSGHMVLSGKPRKKSPLTPPGIDPGTVRLVVWCLNHYSTPSPTWSNTCCVSRFNLRHPHWELLMWHALSNRLCLFIVVVCFFRYKKVVPNLWFVLGFRRKSVSLSLCPGPLLAPVISWTTIKCNYCAGSLAHFVMW